MRGALDGPTSGGFCLVIYSKSTKNLLMMNCIKIDNTKIFHSLFVNLSNQENLFIIITFLKLEFGKQTIAFYFLKFCQSYEIGDEEFSCVIFFLALEGHVN